ncbi:hypothetical protein MicroSTF_14115 [Microbacterium sp. STF-2]|uniref:hypothetical protein n=1 Tax=Microbacterium sp. STF-2 TaxID=3031132 RepID=UPI002AFE8836|nr:hypothetical protein [Microbacterium sp. STF-2]MEA1264174.1 hypothetical protein [Microbacterium sp. STF-2]
MRTAPDLTIDDSPIVPVRAMLRPSTYRALAAVAKEKRLEDVGAVLARLAELSLQPKASRRVQRRRRTPEEYAAIDARVRALNEQRMSDGRIAKALGLSQPLVSQRRRGMGLESPTPRPARGPKA